MFIIVIVIIGSTIITVIIIVIVIISVLNSATWKQRGPREVSGEPRRHATVVLAQRLILGFYWDNGK